jgi:hypothetical protein
MFPVMLCLFRVETTAFQVVQTPNGIEGIPLIMDAIRTHKENTEVVKHLLPLVKQMSAYKDVCEEMISLKVVDILLPLSDQCHSNQDSVCYQLFK